MSRIIQMKKEFPDVAWRQLTHPDKVAHYHYNGFAPDTRHLFPAGHVSSVGRRPFTVETELLQDASVPVRDGSVLRADIFFPNGKRVPAILPWSPYGKTGTGAQQYDNMGPFRCGLDVSMTSGYEKFEGPDPADWTGRGYAVVNIDARGAGDSEGDVVFWGQQEAEDIYDTITWISEQPWCNGSVVMAGNSWLAIAQVNFASRLSHPALKAIAPWECLTDPYRHFNMRGGRPNIPKFHQMLMGGFAGSRYAEDLPNAHESHPLFDRFWETKQMHVQNIDVPVYQVASYSSQLHTRGSFEVMEMAKTSKKWLRVHPYQEWFDHYRPDMVDDLQKFFDCYATGLPNGWEESTPPLRLSLLGFDGGAVPTVVERPYPQFPVPGIRYATYYLDAEHRVLSKTAIGTQGQASHESHHLTATSDFVLKFSERTELFGLSKVKLWMSCAEHNDLDVCVQIRKVGTNGRLLAHLNYPCPVPEPEVPDLNIAKTLGPEGCLRASHSVSLDESRSTDIDKYYRHDRQMMIEPGKVVPLEITLWPMGMVFGPGEGIVLRPIDDNVGIHTVHCGGGHDSHLVLPFLTG